jgi:carbon-monoxide dehydrogenase small subunit
MKSVFGATVNGRDVQTEIEPRELLVDTLRDSLNLTGTHVGCGTGHCGACTVLLNGRAVKSCTVLAESAAGGDIVTIEGLGRNGTLHPLQQAYWDEHAFQCGFCLPGMLLAAVELLEYDPEPDEQAVRDALAGNLCRCTGYQNAIRAVSRAVTNRREAAEGSRESLIAED